MFEWIQVRITRWFLWSLQEQLDQIEYKLSVLITIGGELVSKAQEIRDALEAGFSAVDIATDEIAQDLTDLRNQLANTVKPGMTDAEADAVKAEVNAKFAPIVARLTELGKDPENPVPEV